MDLPEYQYLPLQGDDIRVASLQPGNFDDDICMEIVHTALVKVSAPSDGSSFAARIHGCWSYLKDEMSAHMRGCLVMETLANFLAQGLVSDRYPKSPHDFSSLEDVCAVLDAIISSPLDDETRGFSQLKLFTRNRIRATLHNALFTGTGPEPGSIRSCPPSAQPGDSICVFLGCYGPIIIRPVGDGTFKIVSRCYVEGLMNAEALLGPLPPPLDVTYDADMGRGVVEYVNSETGEETLDDPRLEPLPKEWHRIEHELTMDDPKDFSWFRNRETGEEINYDLRMTAEALRQRGVELQTFRLV